MLKQLSIAGALALSISSANAQTMSWPELTTENVGKGIGAVSGAILGSKIGGGHGTTAAIAAGTLAGYWAGGKFGAYLSEKDRQGINRATSKAMNSGKSTSWDNPDTGIHTRINVKDISDGNLKAPLTQLPPIELINAYYLPTTDINVRGGPGTEYAVSHLIKKGKAVPVAGKVRDSDWYLIAESGKASGFLYAPLMAYAPMQPVTSNAIRDASAIAQPGRYAANSHSCRIITQRLSLHGASKNPTQFKACQQTNGSWVKI